MYLREFHFRHLLFQALEWSRVRKNQDFDSEIRTRIRKVGKPNIEIWMLLSESVTIFKGLSHTMTA